MMAVEKQTGTSSFEPVSLAITPDANGAIATVRPGARRDFELSVTPGRYRATLRSEGRDGLPVSRAFEVNAVSENLPPPGANATPTPREAQPPAENTVATDPAAAQQGPVEVSLVGMASAADGVRFSFRLTFSDGREERLQLALGDTLLAPWIVSEYNADRRTVTLSDAAGGVFTIKSGQRLPLQGDKARTAP
jgi:hypothetical protein